MSYTNNSAQRRFKSNTPIGYMQVHIWRTADEHTYLLHAGAHLADSRLTIMGDMELSFLDISN